jgi:Protein of unknown function (DUF935)
MFELRLPYLARRFQEAPRKPVSGTSYTATGQPGVRPPNIESEAGSAQPVRIREIVPQLTSPFARLQIYSQMMNDAAVDVSMRLYKTPVLGAEFFVEPFSHDPADIEISEFIWANLAEGMSAPFLNSLEDILHMYEDGFSVLEPVYEEREWAPKRKAANRRVYTMLKKLGVRPSSTITTFNYDDNGGPVSVMQSAIRSDGTVDEVELAIENIIIFTFNRRGGDLTGKSLLRTAHPHWYYKTHMYKIDAIQKERHAIGVPRGKLLPGYSPGDKAVLRQLLRNLRTNEESFFIETPNVEISFAEVSGGAARGVDVLGSANHHNTMILLNVLGQFIGLGVTQEGGGRATAATQSDMFMKSLRFVANQIAMQINMYLIPQLVVWNYPTTNFPRLQVRNIGETRDLQMFAAALANLFSQQVVTGDEETENWVRTQFDMPAKQFVEAPPVAPSGNGEVPEEKRGSVRGGIKTGYVGKSPAAAE